jgi:hypothetical protein
MRGSNKLIPLTAGVAVCSLVATAFHAPTPVMATLAFALLASLGYVWIAVILQGRAPTLELVSVAVGLVLAAPVLGGVVLDEAGVPLSRAAWSTFFVGLTLVGDVALAFRYRSHTREHQYDHEHPRPVQRQDRPEIARPDLRPPWEPIPGLTPQPTQRMAPRPRGREESWWRISPLQAGACGLAVLIAGGAIWVARAGAVSQQYPGFTELWLSSNSHSTSTDNLGVSNHEGRTEKYRLVLLRKGHVSATWDLTLTPGQTWQRAVQVTVQTRANLYIPPDMSRPYRYVDTGP